MIKRGPTHLLAAFALVPTIHLHNCRQRRRRRIVARPSQEVRCSEPSSSASRSLCANVNIPVASVALRAMPDTELVLPHSDMAVARAV